MKYPMKYAINLLNEKEIPLLDRVFYFFLNYLRYIIVITQLVVIGVFFYRFRIDQSIVDLKESVDQKKEIIKVVLPLLKQASKIDQRMKETKKLLSTQKKFSNLISYLTGSFPETIFLVKLNILPGTMKLSGIAYAAKDLQAYYVFLKKDNKFTKIDLQNLKKVDNGYSFDLILENYKDN